MMETYRLYRMDKDFLWRRLHSLTGLFFALYLIEHLLVNSQAALLIGEDGSGFVRAVNHIHDLPYLIFLEIFLLGVPILIHMYWGIKYLYTSKQNYYGSDLSKPILNQNPRNRAYTWQRITSWVLLVGVIAHVVHMRFLEYPESAQVGGQKNYLVRVSMDSGLETLAARLGFHLYTKGSVKNSPYNLKDMPLKEHEAVAVTSSFGMAELLIVRNTFKMPMMIALYTIFVLSACYHGFNGLWTFMIKWGITLSERSQFIMKKVSTGIMVLVAIWGLSAIWLTYWINLKN
jgi:succinate dehydrogenase cytochrome b subunit